MRFRPRITSSKTLPSLPREQGCRNPGEGGMGRIYLHNNLTVSPSIVWVWSTSTSPPIIWVWCTSERRCPLEFGEKSVPFLVKTFYIFGSSLNLLTWKNRGRGSSPQCWKWGKVGVKLQIIPSPMLNKDRHPCSWVKDKHISINQTLKRRILLT